MKTKQPHSRTRVIAFKVSAYEEKVYKSLAAASGKRLSPYIRYKLEESLRLPLSQIRRGLRK